MVISFYCHNQSSIAQDDYSIIGSSDVVATLEHVLVLFRICSLRENQTIYELNIIELTPLQPSQNVVMLSPAIVEVHLF